MELTKILAEVGDENIGLQNLAQCATKMNYNQKKGYSYTFSTDQSFGPQGPDKACLILWIDRDVLAQAVEKVNQKDK